MGDDAGIGAISVIVSELQAILESNRAAHRDTFERALVVFRKEAVEKLDALLEVVRSGKLPKYLSVGLPIPEEHTDDYDRVLRMLRMHVGTHISLSERAYRQLVDDDWGWRQSFTSNTTSYTRR